MNAKSHIFYIIALAAILCGCAASRPQRPVAKAAVSQPLSIDEEWKLVSIKGRDISYPEGHSPITLRFNPEARTFSGTTSCNKYGGDYTEGRFSGSTAPLSFENVSATKTTCPEGIMKMEKQFFNTLKYTTSYYASTQVLTLYQKERPILVFEKANH